MGVAGLLVGILGFGLTLWQLSKLKTTAQASSEAVQALKVKMTAFDALQEVASAEASSRTLRKEMQTLDPEKWDGLADEIERSLMVLAELEPFNGVSFSEEISIASTQVISLSKKSENQHRSEISDRDRIRESLRTINRTLVGIKANIQRSQ